MGLLSLKHNELRERSNAKEAELQQLFRMNGVKIKEAKGRLNERLNGTLG